MASISEETRARMSAALMGRPVSPQTRAKLSAAMRGRRLSDEHRAKLSVAHQGKSLSAEHAASVSSAMRGLKRSPEHQAKLSESMRSPETRAKLSAALRRRFEDPVQRARLIERVQSQAARAARLGKTRLEVAAEALLSPLGFSYHTLRRGRCTFDFSHESLALVVEINGCGWWHDHHAVGDCGSRVAIRPDAARADARRRSIAKFWDLRLLELWSCEQSSWPEQIARFMKVQGGTDDK